MSAHTPKPHALVDVSSTSRFGGTARGECRCGWTTRLKSSQAGVRIAYQAHVRAALAKVS